MGIAECGAQPLAWLGSEHIHRVICLASKLGGSPMAAQSQDLHLLHWDPYLRAP